MWLFCGSVEPPHETETKMIQIRDGVGHDPAAKSIDEHDEAALAQFEELEAFIRRLQTGRITLLGIPGMPNTHGSINVTTPIVNTGWDYDKATLDMSVVTLFPVALNQRSQVQAVSTLVFSQEDWRSILMSEVKQTRRFFRDGKLIAVLNIPAP